MSGHITDDELDVLMRRIVEERRTAFEAAARPVAQVARDSRRRLAEGRRTAGPDALPSRSRTGRWGTDGSGRRAGTLVLLAALLAAGAAATLPGTSGPSPEPEAVTGHLVATGPMSGVLTQVSGIELTDGRVLVVGQDRRAGAGAAELWDPATGTFAAAGSDLGSFTDGATLVAIPGGKAVVSQAPGRFILQTGGDSARPALWEPATLAVTPIALPRDLEDWRPLLTLDDGRVLGTGRRPDMDARSVAWDPATGVFEDLGELDVRATYGTRLRDARVLVAGMLDDRSIRVSLLDGGGHPSSSTAPRAHEAGQDGDPPPRGSSRFEAVHLPDDRIAFLTVNGGVEDAVQVWDPRSDAFVPIPFGDAGPVNLVGAAALADTRVLVGGASYLGETTWIWNPGAGATVDGPGPDPGEPHYGWSPAAIVPLHDGRVLLVGGTGAGSDDDTSFIYTP